MIKEPNQEALSFEPVMVELSRLVPDDSQAREFLREDLVERLARDIEANGLQYALLVRPLAQEPGVFGVYDGWHRLEALKRNEVRHPRSYPRVPCRIRELDDASALILSLNLNHERGELSPLEQADALARLRQVHGLTWREVTERTNRRDEDYVRGFASTSWNVCPGLREMNRIRPIPTSILLAVATDPEETQLLAGRRVLEGRKVEDILREVDPDGRGRSRVLGSLFGLRKQWLKQTEGHGPIAEGARVEALRIREVLLDWVALIDEFVAREEVPVVEDPC